MVNCRATTYTEVNLNPHTYIQHTKPTSPRHIHCPSQGQGSAVAGGPRGPDGETRVRGDLGLSTPGHSVDCFNSHVFPKQEKRTQKGCFKSRLSSATRFSSGTWSHQLKGWLPCMGGDRTFTPNKEISLKDEIEFSYFHTRLSLWNSVEETCLNVFWAACALISPPFGSPADAVAIKNDNYPSGLINIRIITPLEYKQAVMNMGS